MIIDFIHHFYNKYNILIFKIDNKILGSMLCDIAFLAID